VGYIPRLIVLFFLLFIPSNTYSQANHPTASAQQPHLLQTNATYQRNSTGYPKRPPDLNPIYPADRSACSSLWLSVGSTTVATSRDRTRVAAASCRPSVLPVALASNVEHGTRSRSLMEFEIAALDIVEAVTAPMAHGCCGVWLYGE